MPLADLQFARTPVLDVGHQTAGDPGGWPVVLLHGFPYDVRVFDEVADRLAAEGARVVAPYLRGFGPTRFRDPGTPRSGQQAALGADLVDLLDALDLDRALLAGFDWGGRAACVVAALHPERVRGLVTANGYAIHDLATAGEPAPPAFERSYWYQYYFHSERGRAGLAANRDELCELLWTTWSPRWAGASAAFAASAPSLHNPDFVDVVVHSYRHRYALVDGDPRYAEPEAALAGQPAITLPATVISSGSDGVLFPDAADDRDRFTGSYRFVHLPDAGHDVPQEDPASFAGAVLELHARAGAG